MTIIYNRRALLIFMFMLCFGIVSKAQDKAQDSVKKIEQVRQIGYGEQLVSGSVSSVSGNELRKTFVPNTANTLFGQIPGLTVQQTGAETGVGLDSPILNSRGLSTFGTGTGLYILVDGYESNFEQLVPSEIESITLLKDASATAIYGSKGANGVLLITTKRGQAGPLQVTFSTQQGVMTPTRMPKYLGSYDYARLYNEALINDGKKPVYSDTDLDAYLSGNDPLYHPDVDWYKEVLRKSAPMADYDLNFRGGNNTARYFVLLNVLNSQGLYIKSGDMSDNSTNSNYRRFNYRSNVDLNLNSNLSAHLTLGGNVEDKSNPAAINSTGIFNQMSLQAPNLFPIYNPNKTFGSSMIYSNPLGDILETGFFTSNSRTFQANLKMTENLNMIAEGLSASAAISFNNYFIGYSSKSRNYQAFSIKQDSISGNPLYTKIGQNTSLAGSEGGSQAWRYFAMQAFLNYDHSFGLNDISSVLVFNNSNYVAVGSGLPFKDMGVFGRATIVNNKKYIGEFSFGYNGSENFPDGHKYGFFPAGSLAWVISNEGFLKDNSAVNYLKLRLSYGLTGNDNIGGRRFMYNQDMVGGSSYYLGATTTSTGTYGEGQIANPNVTWEKQKQLNIGLDATLFGHFDFTADVFNQDRYDILAYPYRTIPAFTGMSIPQLNIGKVNNRGFEATVRYNSNVKGSLQYFAEASGSYAKNKIEYFEAYQANDYLNYVGYPINQPFVLEANGYFANDDDIAASPLQIFAPVKPGDLKYKDQNGDNIVNQLDFIPAGDTKMPVFTGSFRAGLTWKGFDLSFLAQGVAGRTVYLSGNYFGAFQNNGRISEFALGRWTPETAESASYPRLSSENNLNNYQNSTFWQRNGDFIKLRNAEIGYSIPSSLLQKINLKSARVYVNGTNLFSLDYLDFADPESIGLKDSSGKDISGYPTMRTFSVGVRLQM